MAVTAHVEDFPAFFARMTREPVYVILGVQGSGTNLLGKLLTRLSGFSVLQDYSLVVRAGARLRPDDGDDAIERQFRHLCAEIDPPGWKRKLKKCLVHRSEALEGMEDAFAGARPRTPAELVRFVYAYRAYRTGLSTMAIKSDDLWEQMDALDRLIPNRRIILLTRDFRDNVMSMCGKNFGPIEPVVAAHYVKSRFAHYEAEYRRADASGFHVRYEDILSAPGPTLQALCAHFALPVLIDPAGFASEFREGKVRRWASLTRRDLAWCESVLGDELDRYGYGRETRGEPPPGPVNWYGAVARDIARRVPQKIGHFAKQLRA